jgi:putative membrane-bound dehydrogenase-like protein
MRLALLSLALSVATTALGGEANRLAYLDSNDPYYVGLDFPKLTTPQWVGEDGVEAVVVLAIDDMTQNAPKYEAFLRPILDRLKAIDGRAALSIMTNRVDAASPEVKRWLAEGVSLEAHTLTHPCPLLQKGDFAEAQRTYHGCVDLLGRIPGNHPVAFRMPCCDSRNTVSPRFFAEIFNATSPEGNALAIDSSVFMLFTPDDPSLPRALVLDPDGRERFRKYLPFPSFVNTIENYPYPYVINRLCWEFPCVVPSDWEGQNLLKPNNPRTLEDMKAALDCVVAKQGVFNLVFHPHNWIQNTQIVALIDHAVAKHGRKVRFLNFREALERINQNLLGGQALRGAKGSNGIQLLDLNDDGYLDVVIRNDDRRETRIWDRAAQSWKVSGYEPIVERPRDPAVRFLDLDEDGYDDLVHSSPTEYLIVLFDPATSAWSRLVMSGRRTPAESLKPDTPLPPFVRLDPKTGRLTDNGAWVHSRHIWWQNEDTAELPDLVNRRSFNDLLKNVEPRAKGPTASLRSMRVRPGFRVGLMVHEPLVQSPIAFDWAPDGRMWVLEMGDYPLGADGKGRPGGNVRLLSDTDGDGRYDKATSFLAGLAIPSGIMAWGRGVLIACAPDILYAEDTNGDGWADVKKVLFTGFTEGNPQHRLNGFDFGLDGWVYGANGDSGGNVRSLATGKTVAIGGRDFRFRPDTGEFEAESGQTQYGRHRDDWGNWFGNNNPNWAWVYMLSEHDIKRNPRFAPPDPRQMLEPDNRLYPVSRTLPRFNDLWAANRVTSANSPTPYRDELFGPGFENSLFVSEPVHNLVHRIVLEPDGVTWRGGRAAGEEEREFLASSDNWFRPTMMRTGPDGALWIADMYRAVIEHPEWIPDDWEAKLDLRAGADKGRIYRVYPVNQQPRPIANLAALDSSGLVGALDSPNGWTRDTAQRLLMERKDVSAVEVIRRLAASSERPKSRVQALWTLKGLGELRPEIVVKALDDMHPKVRRAAIAAYADRLNEDPRLGQAMLARADDPDPRVRFALALALGDWAEPRAGSALARLLRSSPDDPWMRAAVLTSAAPHASAILAALFGEEGRGAAVPSEVVGPLFATAAGSGQGLAGLVESVAAPKGPNNTYAPWQFAAVAGLLQAVERDPLERRAENDPTLRQALGRLETLYQSARTVAGNTEVSEDDRLAAIRLLGRSTSHVAENRERLRSLLGPRVPARLQEAAVAALTRSSDPEIPKLLLAGWKSQSPALRTTILDAIVSRSAWANVLLAALERGEIAPAEVDPAHRRRLLGLRDAALRQRAETILSAATSGRREVIDRYRSALDAAGEATAGAAVFKKVCASCHRLKGEGTEVGPDLATLTDKSPESLLVAILDPNRAFEAKYTNFLVETTDGRVLSGMIAAETANSVTLRRQEGKEDVLLRSDIEAMAGSGQSVMPEGLEKDLTPRDLADVIAYLNSTGPPRKTVEGNQPDLARPGEGGAIVLRASAAEIYGDTLTFESMYRNLGYWSTLNDRAAWSFEVERPGRFEVWLDYACADPSQGNHYVLDTGKARLEGTVAGTGTWDDYRRAKIGELDLAAGRQRLEMRPAERIKGAMIDLRAIELRRKN